MTYGESDIVANDGSGRRGHHYKRQMQMTLSVVIASDKKNGFARYRQSGVLEHHAKKHGPVAVYQHVILDKFERVVNKVHRLYPRSSGHFNFTDLSITFSELSTWIFVGDPLILTG